MTKQIDFDDKYSQIVKLSGVEKLQEEKHLNDDQVNAVANKLYREMALHQKTGKISD